ncbi:1656_t:CDS:2 [Acaulospora morrowiae]|uniref:1656_t:CDS:1 n=1 Tax=Acaulospora morrowiae TaxID=94023 RepID=A0A9N9F4Y0_9GLOM|nr:1656_t:CDS:2 [Acaulospora morrowiae]
MTTESPEKTNVRIRSGLERSEAGSHLLAIIQDRFDHQLLTVGSFRPKAYAFGKHRYVISGIAKKITDLS